MRILVPILIVPLLGVVALASEIMTFEPVADAFVSEGEPNWNYGGAEFLRVSSHFDPAGGETGSGIRRALIRFDLGEVPTYVVVRSVRLEAYQSDTRFVGDGFDVYRAGEAWAEGSVTWNTQPAVGAELGRMLLAPDQYCSFASDALTQTVRSWLEEPASNYGLALRFHDEWLPSPEGGLLGDTLRSRQSAADTRPRLIVEYDLSEPLMGDADLDGKVGIADLTILADHYGIQDGATWEMGDFDGDGKVSIADLSILADHYGREFGAVMPEPTAMILLAGGAAALGRRRRRR